MKRCNTAKYKRLMRKQRQNAAERKLRQLAIERYWSWKRKEEQRKLAAAQAADPERQLHQRLVNILNRRLHSSPLYRTMLIARLLSKELGPWYFIL